MINTYFDLETVPNQSNRQEFVDNAISNYKPPSSLSKTAACSALGLSPAETKVISKDESIIQWVKKFGEENSYKEADHEWRKTALDGTYGEVISIAWAVGDSEIFAHARAIDSPVTEAEMIQEFFVILNDWLTSESGISIDKPYFIGHNIPFDLKFLFRRAVILGIKPPFELPFSGYHGKDYFDNMYAWCGRGEKISQHNLCKALGLEGKPEGVTGATVWDYVKAGKIDEVVEYNKDDIRAVREVYNRLQFL